MNKEYIDKHEAYLLLKQKAETYMLPATKEAYEKAAILIDSMECADVQPVDQWYSVEENQPDSVGDDVLVVDSYGEYHIAYYLSVSENWMNQDTREPIKDVVKWRYLDGDSDE